MRQVLVVGLCSASLLLMGNKGCGESLKEEVEQGAQASAEKCAELAVTLAALEERAGHCSDTFVYELSEEDGAACAAAYSQCDDTAKSKLDDAMACFNQLGACDLASEAAFRSSAEACESKAGSTDCGLKAFLNEEGAGSGGTPGAGGGP